MRQAVITAMYIYIKSRIKIDNTSSQPLIAMQELLLALHGKLPHLLLQFIDLGNDPPQSQNVSPLAFERYLVIPPYFN